jgi:hypothetical protein
MDCWVDRTSVGIVEVRESSGVESATERGTSNNARRSSRQISGLEKILRSKRVFEKEGDELGKSASCCALKPCKMVFSFSIIQ